MKPINPRNLPDIDPETISFITLVDGRILMLDQSYPYIPRDDKVWNFYKVTKEESFPIWGKLHYEYLELGQEKKNLKSYYLCPICQEKQNKLIFDKKELFLEFTSNNKNNNRDEIRNDLLLSTFMKEKKRRPKKENDRLRGLSVGERVDEKFRKLKETKKEKEYKKEEKNDIFIEKSNFGLNKDSNKKRPHSFDYNSVKKKSTNKKVNKDERKLFTDRLMTSRYSNKKECFLNKRNVLMPQNNFSVIKNLFNNNDLEDLSVLKKNQNIAKNISKTFNNLMKKLNKNNGKNNNYLYLYKRNEINDTIYKNMFNSGNLTDKNRSDYYNNIRNQKN